jgi:hypothetical protein
MIKSKVGIRGKNHLEIKTDYKFENDSLSRNKSYQIEAFFFLPDLLSINKRTYPKYLFYRDMCSYIRLKTPKFSLSDLLLSPKSPLIKLKKSYNDYKNVPNDRKIKSVENDSKIFCSIYRSSLSMNYNIFKEELIDELNNLLLIDKNDSKRITENYNLLMGKISLKIDRFLKQINEINRLFRLIFKDYRTLDNPDLINSIFSKNDEYISLLYDVHMFRIIDLLNSFYSIDSKFSTFKNFILLKDEIKTKLIEDIKSEQNYRISKGYKAIFSEKGENRDYLFRRSVLKKYIQSVLYLDTRTKKEGKILQEFIFSLAAASAVAVTTIFGIININNVGKLTLPVISLAVISYIFKDRIKDWTKKYLSSKLHNYLYDNRTKIYLDSNKIGYCRERVDFINYKKISSDIERIKQSDFFISLINNNNNNILAYKKKIILNTKIFDKIYFGNRTKAIKDILRFDLSKLFKKMDAPVKKITIIDLNNKIKKVDGHRTYKINLVLKLNSKNNSELVFYDVILDKNRIVEISKI